MNAPLPPAHEESGSALEYLSVLVDRWRSVGWTAFTAVVVTIILTYVLPPTYTAKVVLIPAAQGGGGGLGALGGVAARLGMNVGGGNATDEPEFYVALARSREILTEVAHSRMIDPKTGDSTAMVMDRLGILPDGSMAAREEETVRELRSSVNPNLERQSQTVTINVNAGSAQLAADIANDVAYRIDRFNREKRTFQTRESRIFTEQQMNEAEASLRTAENALRDFRIQNRRVDSPALEFEDGRLQRQVQIRQEVYLTLRREYETSRIAEVNDTPLLIIVDHAVAPVKRSWPRRSRLATLAMVFGLAGGIILAFGQQYVATLEASGDPTVVKLRNAVAAIKARVVALIKRRK